MSSKTPLFAPKLGAYNVGNDIVLLNSDLVVKSWFAWVHKTYRKVKNVRRIQLMKDLQIIQIGTKENYKYKNYRIEPNKISKKMIRENN